MARRPATSQPHVLRCVAMQTEANHALRYVSQMFTQEIILTTSSNQRLGVHSAVPVIIVLSC